jgi:hypothetical protein
LIGLLPFRKYWIDSGRVCQRRKIEEDNLMVKRWTIMLKDRVEDGVSKAIWIEGGESLEKL